MGSGKEENGTIEIKIKDWKKRVGIIILKICTQDSSIIKRQLLCKIKLPFILFSKMFSGISALSIFINCFYLLVIINI